MENLIFEVISPPQRWSQEKTNEWTDQVCDLIKRENIKTISLPEVLNETRDEERTVPFYDKIDNFDFAQLLTSKNPEITPIPNKICVRYPLSNFMENVDKMYQAGTRHLVLVGGEHSTIKYPGPTVTNAAKAIKEKYPDLILGGISIFTRKNEAERIFAKSQNGIDFFISQIIFETSNMKRVMLNLEKICSDKQVTMPKMYLSLAPATKKTDISFMQWLGVEFPSAIYSYFMDKEEESVESRVFEVVDLTLDEIHYFMSQSNINLGFNLEQVMYNNHQSVAKLIQSVKKRFML